MTKIILIVAALAAALVAAYFFGILPRRRRNPGESNPESETEPDNSYEIDELVVGKKYGDCQLPPVGDTPGKPESTDGNNSTFATQDVRDDEPMKAEKEEQRPQAESPQTAPDGTDPNRQVHQYSYELVLVDGDDELGQEAMDDTRALPVPRPVIPMKDTGKKLEELIYDDQPEFEADATESERQEMESFEFDDFR